MNHRKYGKNKGIKDPKAYLSKYKQVFGREEEKIAEFLRQYLIHVSSGQLGFLNNLRICV